MSQTSAVAPEAPTVPRDVAELLLELGTATQRHAIYPKGHPLLTHAVDGVMRRLDGVMRSRESLALGVAREQLVVDGIATDASHLVLRELAQRLHRHHVGAIKLRTGIASDELGDLLSVLSLDPNLTNKHLGPLTGQLQRWPHVRLNTLTYDRLALSNGDGVGALGTERAASLWLSLARAGLGLAQDSDDPLADPESMARAIEGHEAEEQYDRSVVGCLLEITEALRNASGIEAESLSTRVSQLIRSLPPETLRRLLALGGDVAQRRKLVANAADDLAVDAVLTLVKAAADASNQNISHAMLRLLSKLALQAEEGAVQVRAGANAALREQVHQLLERWDADLLNPDSYQKALDRLSRLRLLAVMKEREYPCEPRRLVALAMEINMLGAPVWRAVAEMLAGGEIGALLDILDRSLEGNAVALELWQRVATTENVSAMLREEQVDPALLDRIAARMGINIVDPLLDALEAADARAMRRKLIDMLTSFGADLAPPVMGRLRMDAPWFVLRNLLALLGRLPAVPREFVGTRYMTHGDPRVRREAFKLQLRLLGHRDEAVTLALADTDERMLQMALSAATDSCPRAAVPIIIRRVTEGSLHGELRLQGVRVVATVRTSATLDWLLTLTVARRRWFRRRRLAAKSPEMLAALSGLAAQWSAEPRAVPVLALARRDADTEIRAAIESRGS